MKINLRQHPVQFVSVLGSIAIIFFLAVSCGQGPAPRPPIDSPVALIAPAILPDVPGVIPDPVPAINPKTTQDEKEPKADRPTRSANESLFDSLMRPFTYEAQIRREDRARKEPDSIRRLDKDLNEGRINFVLFGYGETHEPPATERAFIGSNTILSYDTRTQSADIISFTHDIRAPEIERELKARGQKVNAVKIDQAYNVGGFRLMRNVLENATGLSMDFQISFKDVAIKKFVDDVYSGVEVNVADEFKVHPFYLDGKKYPEAKFLKGKQTLNGTQVIQFIKTVPVTEGYYGKSLEHNTRKHVVFQALLAGLSQRTSDKTFWLKGTAFITAERINGEIVYDFDPVSLAVNNIGATAGELKKYLDNKQTGGLQMPQIRKTTYICDPTCGDGGIRWVDGDTGNPNTIRDMQKGVYPPGGGIEIPFDANADGDLVTEYWTSVRAVIKNILMSKTP
jgi:hypothetical protein